MISIKLLAKKKQMRKLLKPNTILNLANGLKTLLQDLLLCDLLARFQKYSLSLRRYSTLKSPQFIFC